MLEHLPRFLSALHSPHEHAIATIVAVAGSAPRAVGTSVAVHRDGTTVGSLSGGCLEAAVVHEALLTFDDPTPRLLHFTPADGDLLPGLTCGGTVTVLVEPATALSALTTVADAAALALVRWFPEAPEQNTGPGTGSGPACATPREHSRALTPPATALVDPATGAAVRSALNELLDRLDPCEAHTLRELVASGTSTSHTVTDLHTGQRLRVLVESRIPEPSLVIYGAGDHAAALAQAATPLGWEVTVCDHRPLFTTPERHPHADHVVVERAGRHLQRALHDGLLDERSAVIVLSHDPDVDTAVLSEALRTDLAYVGAMGSRGTHAARLDRLRAAGLSDTQLARLHSPIGVAIGASGPQEFAISVLAELISERRLGTSPASLRATAGPVHQARAGGGPAFPAVRTLFPHPDDDAAAAPGLPGPGRALDRQEVPAWT